MALRHGQAGAGFGRGGAMKTMSREEQEARKPGAGRPARQFTKDELSRMFRAREDGVTDADIARRFRVDRRKIRELIGRRLEP